MLSKPLPVLKSELRDLLIDNLAEAHNALRDLLPEGSDKHGLVIGLKARLTQLNTEKIRGVIDSGEYEIRLARISASTLELIEALEDADFQPQPAENKGAAKLGTVLYRIPQRMPLQKPSICTVRVATDEAAIAADIVLDNNVKVRSKVEISARMSAELLDMEGGVFEIYPFNATQQNVREYGYTQWLFRVKPLRSGEHQLLVKISLMEFDENTRDYIPRDVSIFETVTILAEAPLAEEDAAFKSSGESFTLKGGEAPSTNSATGSSIPLPQHMYEEAAQYPAPVYVPETEVNASPPKNSGGVPRPLRTLTALALFLVVGGSATWALTPGEVRDWWLASVLNTEASYAAYIEKHASYKSVSATKSSDEPLAYVQLSARVEKAYYRRALRSERLTDLREYDYTFPNGQYASEIRGRIQKEEQRYVDRIEREPSVANIEQYLADFPDATQLSRVKQAAERLPEGQRVVAMPKVQDAYARSMEVAPTAEKFEQYRRDFPKMELATQMAGAPALPRELKSKIQGTVDSILVRKVEDAQTSVEVAEALREVKDVGSEDAVRRTEQIIEKKPLPIKREAQPQLRELKKKRKMEQ